MTKLPTIYEILNEHNNAVFTFLHANGEKVFMRPLKTKHINAGLDGYFRDCCVSEINSETILGVEYVTVTLRD